MTVQKERLVTLSDGTCMNDILYVIHTDAPVLVLKELEMLSCKAYEDGAEDEVPIWKDVIEGKGYKFEYIDEQQHITAFNSSRSWLEEKYPQIAEHYIIENQPSLKK
ncbi:MAG: hypothetical protein Q4C84_15670 [Bacillota bacterium]|jgi:hypothetical protein|nr:hypothetical protein [Bacillota bacterium]